MKIASATIGIVAVTVLTGWGEHRQDLQWPHAGRMPDDPVPVKPLRYDPITKGNQSYRPIDPMPWGDVNKRVMPKSSETPAAPAPSPAAPMALSPARPAAPGVRPVPPASMPDHSKHGAPKP